MWSWLAYRIVLPSGDQRTLRPGWESAWPCAVIGCRPVPLVFAADSAAALSRDG